jgi:SAM-dependent methyltransferase
MLTLENQNALRRQYQQRNPQWRPATEVYADTVRRCLPANGRLLDLGCGRGGLVEQLNHPLPLTVGVDPDFTSLREHRLALPRAVALSRHLPFLGGQFDLVLASWVLEHMAQPAADLAQISRVLKPGGVFVFITPNRRHPLIGLNRLVARLGLVQGRLIQWLYGRDTSDTFPAYYRANTAVDLQQLAASNQMHLSELQAIADPTYLAFTPALFRLLAWLEARLPAEMAVHLVGAIRKDEG